MIRKEETVPAQASKEQGDILWEWTQQQITRLQGDSTVVHTPDTTEVIDHSSGDKNSKFEKDWKEVQEAATNGVIDQLEWMAITQSSEGKVQLRNSFFQKALEL